MFENAVDLITAFHGGRFGDHFSAIGNATHSYSGRVHANLRAFQRVYAFHPRGTNFRAMRIERLRRWIAACCY